MLRLTSFLILLASFALSQPSGLSPFCQPASNLRFRLRFREAVEFLSYWWPFSGTGIEDGRGANPASTSNSSKSGPNGYHDTAEE